MYVLQRGAGEGNGNPLQYSCLANPMDRGAWWAAVHGVARSWTRLSDFTFPFPFHALEKETATHSSVLAWRIAGTAEPGGLPFLGSHRVGHDWSDLVVVIVVQRGELTLLKPHSKLVATDFKSEVSFPSYTVNLCPWGLGREHNALGIRDWSRYWTASYSS